MSAGLITHVNAELVINDYTTSYVIGDIIPITGTVDIPSEITIQIISPNGNLATVRQLSAETQIFALNVTSGGPLFSQQVHTQYMQVIHMQGLTIQHLHSRRWLAK